MLVVQEEDQVAADSAVEMVSLADPEFLVMALAIMAATQVMVAQTDVVVAQPGLVPPCLLLMETFPS